LRQAEVARAFSAPDETLKMGEGFPFKPNSSRLVGLLPGRIYHDDHMDAMLWGLSVLASGLSRTRILSITSQVVTKLFEHPVADPLPPRVHHRPGRRLCDVSTLILPFFWPPPPGGTVGHWATVLVRMEAASIVLADSMHVAFPARGRAVLAALPLILNKLLLRDGGRARVWSTAAARCTQQRNGVDCGPMSVAALLPLLWPGVSRTLRSGVEELRHFIALFLYISVRGRAPLDPARARRLRPT
jgi:hypothetical protein